MTDQTITYPTADDALPSAKIYCQRDGEQWIMRRPDGRYQIVNPKYGDHYITLGLKVVYRLAVYIKIWQEM